MASISNVKYYRDDAALTILGNLTEQNSENTQTLADVSVRLSTLEDSSSINVMGSGNSYAAGLVLAGSATHGSEFLRKDGTWQIQTDTIYSVIGTNSRADGATQYAAGLVPQGSATTSDHTFLRKDGVWQEPGIMGDSGRNGEGTTSSQYHAGLVPAGQSGGTRFLKEDGQWATPTDTTYSVQDGQLSQNNFTTTLKNKLDGIAASANNYTLPIAGDVNGTIGGIKVGNNLSIDNSGAVTARRDGFNGVNFMDQYTTTGSGAKQFLLGDGGVIQKWNNNAEGNGADDTMLRLSDHAVQLFGGANGAGLFSGDAYFRVRMNNIYTNKVIPNQSDDRYKSRTTDVGDALSLISQVSVRDYLKHSSLRVEEGVEDTDLTGVSHHREVGVVAQELEQISGLEWLVTEHNGIGSELNRTSKFVNYTCLNIYLLRAFQQLTELNTALTARVAALES